MPISPSADVRVALTLGDAAGIGPEVTLKALTRFQKKNSLVSFLLIGRASFYQKLAHKFRVGLKFQDVDAPDQKGSAGVIPCYYPGEFPRILKYGYSQNEWTRHAYESICLAAKLALCRKLDAIVTAPINKDGFRKAGILFPGHTELLARLANTAHYEMMLVGGPLRVVLVTRHKAIADVPKLITPKKVEETILCAAHELKNSLGISKPRIGVCGLNPHAGENGLMGNEESKKIKPGIAAARKKTSAVITGPISPDVIFYEAYRGDYDAVICMYHDQGLIPLKMISRGGGVNVTLGLPFVRTSPDHGTAYDIAGKSKADDGSMTAAITLAVQIARNRIRHGIAHRTS